MARRRPNLHEAVAKALEDVRRLVPEKGYRLMAEEMQEATQDEADKELALSAVQAG